MVHFQLGWIMKLSLVDIVQWKWSEVIDEITIDDSQRDSHERRKRNMKKVLTMGSKLETFSDWKMSQEAMKYLKHRRREVSWEMEEDDCINEEVVSLRLDKEPSYHFLWEAKIEM